MTAIMTTTTIKKTKEKVRQVLGVSKTFKDGVHWVSVLENLLVELVGACLLYDLCSLKLSLLYVKSFI